MKGDFSRRTFDEAKHYSGVLKQQGRVSLDADANEWMEILAHQQRVRTVDIIGNCCAPLHAGGFKIRHSGDKPNDLLISTGRIYVGGLLCELNPGTKIPVTFPTKTSNEVQVEELKIDGQELENDQWVVIVTREEPEGVLARIIKTDGTNKILVLSKDISSLHIGTDPQLQGMILYSEQPDYPGAPVWEPTAEQTDLVYLDVWERHITAIEDPELREVALGGADTTTRIQTVSQVKILPNVGDVDCSDEVSLWNDEIATSGGRLKTQTIPGTEPEDPCLIAEGGGYKGLENRLYRVEIHDGGDIGTATFKWSRDNGSIAYAIQEFIPDDTHPTKVFKVRLKQLGRDKILKIKENNWLEISGDEADLDTNTAGKIAQVTNVDEAQRIVTLSVNVADHKDEKHPKVRRWDTGTDTDTDTSTPLTLTAAGPITLEDGVQVQFSGDNFKVGDYWTFAARTAIGEIEELDEEPPHGIKHYYCKLALVKWKQDGTAEIKDCRHEFPSLCELPKGEGKGCCTVTVGENGDYQGIQEAVDALNGSGTVCVLPGVYIIDKPITIEGRDVTITGCESASLILNRAESGDDGTVFHIQKSQGITVSNLWCVTLSGGRAVISENSNFVKIHDCLVLAAGVNDLAAAITFQGSSLNTEIRNSLIAGMIGVRYEILEGNNNNIHAASRIEKNTINALQNVVHQTINASLEGFIVEDNMLSGFGRGALAKAYFPEAFFEYAEENALYDPVEIKKAKADRQTGMAFESVSAADVTPVFQLANDLKEAEAAAAKMRRQDIQEISFATYEPVINLIQGAMDAYFFNNIIIGKLGVFSDLFLESFIEKNLILASQAGIVLGSFEGVTIDDNTLTTGGSGIQCLGQTALNLTVTKNRVVSGASGIEFTIHEQNFQIIANAQISHNFISAASSGIKVFNREAILYNFTASDNSIIGCQEFGVVLIGLVENLHLEKDIASFQRVIQRNSVQVKGAGIIVAVSDSKVLDNDITITYGATGQTNFSYGIGILASNCTAANNSIQGIVDLEKKIFPKGGMIIYSPYSESLKANTILRANRISGGIGNGVEIALGINDLVANNPVIKNLVIESNLIQNMGLNGIAVQDGMQTTNNLMIANNKIQRCNRLVDDVASWWKYAGIVLRSGEKIQIIGNEIFENGRYTTSQQFHIGGIYAEQVREVIIANNQIIDNGIIKTSGSEAVIQIPAIQNSGNEDIKIVDNLVKSSLAPALFLGGETESVDSEKTVIITRGLDKKTVITGNHFESLADGPAVALQCSYCVFSNNYVECGDTDDRGAVDLGSGVWVTAIGNVTSAPISGLSISEVVIEHNVVF